MRSTQLCSIFLVGVFLALSLALYFDWIMWLLWMTWSWIIWSTLTLLWRICLKTNVINYLCATLLGFLLIERLKYDDYSSNWKIHSIIRYFMRDKYIVHNQYSERKETFYMPTSLSEKVEFADDSIQQFSKKLLKSCFTFALSILLELLSSKYESICKTPFLFALSLSHMILFEEVFNTILCNCEEFPQLAAPPGKEAHEEEEALELEEENFLLNIEVQPDQVNAHAARRLRKLLNNRMRGAREREAWQEDAYQLDNNFNRWSYPKFPLRDFSAITQIFIFMGCFYVVGKSGSYLLTIIYNSLLH